MRNHRVLATAVALVFLVGVMLVGGVGLAEQRALTGWQTFGSGSAVGQGSQGYPGLLIGSTTLENPAAIRYRILGEPAYTLMVEWAVFCWNEGTSQGRYRSGEFEATMPITKALPPGVQVATWDYCNLMVSTMRPAVNTGPGTLTLELQAKYPA